MCDACNRFRVDRRGFFGLAGAATVALASGLRAEPARASGAATDLTPDRAIEALKAGNARFVADAQVCAADLGARRKQVAAGQAPWATVLSCADSRVPPELVFGGLGLGELFVARNAGNLIDTDVLGTMEYGAEHLGSPLIVVMGHQRCGAVSAACDEVTRKAHFPGSIGPMLEPIVPAARAMRRGGADDLVAATVHESARRTAAAIPHRSRILRHLVHQGKVKIVTAYYELDSGRVGFYA